MPSTEDLVLLLSINVDEEGGNGNEGPVGQEQDALDPGKVSMGPGNRQGHAPGELAVDNHEIDQQHRRKQADHLEAVKDERHLRQAHRPGQQHEEGRHHQGRLQALANGKVDGLAHVVLDRLADGGKVAVGQRAGGPGR